MSVQTLPYTKILQTIACGLTLGLIASPATAQHIMSPVQEMLNSPHKDQCVFPELNLEDPDEEFAIFAAGYYHGVPLPYPIDQSGSKAGQIDIVVNSTSQPVVLMLGAYDPTIWNIQWTEGTDIAGVLVSGFHRQVIAGLSVETPNVTSVADESGKCGFFSMMPEDYKDLNPLSRHLFGKNVDMIFPPVDSLTIELGDPIEAGTELLSSPEVSVESFSDSAPLTREDGLEAALEEGILRPATEEDVESWINAVVERAPIPDIPAIANGGILRPSLHYALLPSTYVILKPFTFPAGMYGGFSVNFFVAEGVPYPEGNPGSGAIYDFNTLECSNGCPPEEELEVYYEQPLADDVQSLH